MNDFEMSVEIAQFLYYFEHSDDTVRMNDMLHSIMEKLDIQENQHLLFQLGFYLMHLYENKKSFEKMTLNLVNLNQIANKNFFENEWFIYTFYESIQFHFAHHAHISKEKILGIGKELKELYYRDNRHLSNFYEGQRSLHVLLGNENLATENFNLFKDFHWSYLCGDEAAYHLANVEYFIFTEQYDEAIKSGNLVIKTAKRNYQKKKAIQLLIVPLLKLEETDKAVKQFRKYISMDEFNLFYFKLLQFYTLTLNINLAIKTFEKNLLRSIEHFTDIECFEFYCQSTFLFYIISRKNGQNIKLSLPSTFEIYNHDNYYEPLTLKVYFENLASAYAQKLDNRNDNEYFTMKLKNIELQENYVKPEIIKLS